MVDAKIDGCFIIRVFSNQGNVCPVKGGHDRNMNAIILQHFFGHIGRIGVWDGIMHMHEFYPIGFYRIHQFTRKRQLVGLVVKQGIVGDTYLMKIKATVENF